MVIFYIVFFCIGIETLFQQIIVICLFTSFSSSAGLTKHLQGHKKGQDNMTEHKKNQSKKDRKQVKMCEDLKRFNGADITVVLGRFPLCGQICVQLV